MAANQGAPKTLKSPRWFSQGARAGCDTKYCCTPEGLLPCCGSIDPGTLPRASRNSRTSAIRIEVSWRHAHFSQPTNPNAPPAGDAGPGRGGSSGPAAGSNGSVSGARTSVIGSPALSGDLRQDRGQLRVGRGLEDGARDMPGRVDHERGRGPGERHHGAEIEGDHLAGVAHARGRDAEVPDKGLGAGLRVTLVHAEEGHAGRLIVPSHRGERRGLRAARGAPRSQEVE